MGNFFNYIFKFFAEKKVIFYSLFILLFSLLIYQSSKIKIDENISDAVLSGEDSKAYKEAFSKTKQLDKIILRIYADSLTDKDILTAYADSFLLSIEQDSLVKRLVKNVNGKIDEDAVVELYSIICHNLPFYMTDEEYKKLDSLLVPEKMDALMQSNYKRLMSPTGIFFKQFIQVDPLNVASPALNRIKVSEANEDYVVYDGYVFSKDYSSLYLFITPQFGPSETKQNEALISFLDDHVEKLKSADSVQLEYFGPSAIAVANAKQIKKDIQVTVSVALLVIVIVIMAIYRKWQAPLFILLPVSFGVAFALCILVLFDHSISALALGAGAVVLGIAVDYSLHLLAHYYHTRSWKEVLEDISMPMLIGSISTVGALYGLTLTNSKILQDFGLFAGSSLIGAALCTLILLPQFIHSFYSVKEDTRTISAEGFLPTTFIAKNKLVIFFGLLILTAFFYYKSSDVQFDGNIAHLSYMPERYKVAEEHIHQTVENEKNVFFLYKGNSISAISDLQEQTKSWIDTTNQLAAQNFKSITTVVPGTLTQKERLDKWNAYWTPEKKNKIKENIINSSVKLGFNEEVFEPFLNSLNTNYNKISSDDEKRLGALLFKDILLQEGNEWSALASTRFPQHFIVHNPISSVVTIDQQSLYTKLVDQIKIDFDQIVLFTSLLVFGILLVSYGRIELALIAFIPMMISWIWILGIMACLGISFNIVNVIVSTFIFGLGDDFSIFIQDGLIGEYQYKKDKLASYNVSILLSAFTTILGIGVLVFAEHPALKSIGLISIIGVSCVWFMSYLFIPMAFRWLITNRTNKKLNPLTMVSFLRTAFIYIYFLLGCILLMVLGGFLFYILRLKKSPRAQYIYHYVLMIFARSNMYIIPSVKKIIINDHKEDFKKPSVIIANHQSLLDILLLVMLYPKLILFTNTWVYNSPFMGWVVRMAGFINVDEGVNNEELTEVIKQHVNNGYSIVIFPEGTRSIDLEMKRFHKGAFALAQELNLDIVPILFWGTGLGIRKSDLVLNNVDLMMKVFPRISSNDHTWGTSYQERTKSISKFMRHEYEQLRQHLPMSYFHNTILSSYKYKGPVLEWYAKVKISLEENYSFFDEQISTNAKVLDIGCGYGFLAYFLIQKSEQRVIVGVDYDDEKIAIAQNSYLKKDTINFYAANALKFEMPKSDVVLFLDILHYLPKASQEIVLQKAIEALEPNGKIIIRDGDPTIGKKHETTKLTEVFSTKIFNFNKKEEEFYFISSAEIQDIAVKSSLHFEMVDNTKYSSNRIYILSKHG